MEYLDLAMRWLHIIPAVALIGGTIFMRVAVVPACNQLDEEQRNQVLESVRRGWSRLLMPSILFLIISGFYNTAMISMSGETSGGYYNGLLGVKLFLAIAIFYIASLLAGRSDAAARFRQRQVFWLNLNILLAVLLICIAGGMKMTRQEKKPSQKDPAEVTRSLEPGGSSNLNRG